MATENLKVKITADASQAKVEIGNFKKTLKGMVSENEAAAAAIGKVTVAVGALVLALKGLKAIAKSAIDVAAQGDAIKDNAQKVFMSTTAYQEWGYVLKQNGVEIASLKTAMRQFSQQVASGSDTLAKYGITATDVDEAFEQAIYTIQNMTTETEKITAATELFGSRALELFPILNLTNQETQSLMETYRALGGTMSNELIAASDICTDSIYEMKMAWGGLRNLLATYVIPVITKIVQWITVAIAKIRILLAAFLGVKETFGGGSKKTSIVGTTGSVADNTGKTAKNLKNANKQAKELRRTLMGIDELSRLAEKATSAASGGGGGIGSIGGGGGSIDLGDMEAANELFSSETLDKIEKFRQKVEALKERLSGLQDIFEGLKKILQGDFSSGFTKLYEGIEKLFPKLSLFSDKWEALRKQAQERILEFKAEFKDNVKAKAQSLQTWWNSLKVAVKPFATAFIDNVKSQWSVLKKWWDGLSVKAKSFTANFVDNVKSEWNSFKNWWNKLKNGTKDFVVNFKFVDKLKNAWNDLVGKINAARNKSSIVRALIPYIPKLAKGGILTAPTAALLGEYAGAKSNPEIATPQSLMYETIQKANGDMVSAFATMTRQVIAAIEAKDLEVNIGDEQIARSAQRGNTAYYNRTGKALLTI